MLGSLGRKERYKHSYSSECRTRRSAKEFDCSLDSARETLVTLGIVVLQADLELDGLDEVATLLAVVGLVQKVLNGASHA